MLNNDYKEMLQCLNAERVDYLLIGAYAMAARGFPRATMDIDIWVKPSTANASAVWKALERFGAPLQGVTVDDFTKDDVIFQIGVAPRRIDIITGVSALNFDETIERAIEVEIEGLKVLIPSVSDLIVNKKATGRTKDLADVETLQTITDRT